MINEQTIRITCEHLAEVLIAKNKDYGNSVQEQFQEYGEASLLIRLDDKLRRLKQLNRTQKTHVKDESKRDTMLDLAGYAILGLLCLSSEDNELKEAEFNIMKALARNPKKLKHDLNFNPHFDQDDQ